MGERVLTCDHRGAHAETQTPETTVERAFGLRPHLVDTFKLSTDPLGFTAKGPPVRNATGLFTKDRFDADLQDSTVTCPT